MVAFEGVIQHFFHSIVLLLNVLSIFIILVGAFFSVIKLIRERGTDFSSVLHKNKYIKAYLGSYILLSLEFLIVADIIELIINPTFQDIIKLALIVLIRTMISYFLNKEISEFSDD